MDTSKPLISILMAIYEPRMDWLKEQLDSLNAQTYPNLKLYIRDDCSPTVPYSEIQNLASKCITAFPYSIERNTDNLGSNATFELLTQEAEGEYFAYCDQDDVWLPEKLEVLQRTIEEEKATLVCSDMFVIDENGKQIADSITKVRKRHVFPMSPISASQLLVKNFSVGCTMMVCSEIAKAAVPFCPYMIHDHFLTLYAAESGAISIVRLPLIYYRIHKGNQTSVLGGVTDRESYYRIRLEELENRLNWLQERFSNSRELCSSICDAKTWIDAREEWFSGDFSKGRTVWKYRRFAKVASLFELTTARLPESVFQYAVRLVQKGVL